LFLDLCIAEKEKFNFTSQGLTKGRWRNVQCSFKQVVGARFSNKQMSNKLQSLKKRYQAWNDLQNSSGLGRNKATGGAEADARWWDEQQTRQDAREVEVSPVRHYLIYFVSQFAIRPISLFLPPLHSRIPQRLLNHVVHHLLTLTNCIFCSDPTKTGALSCLQAV
jgi:hypothetical protein